MKPNHKQMIDAVLHMHDMSDELITLALTLVLQKLNAGDVDGAKRMIEGLINNLSKE